jgi:hypothetical protein
VECRWPTEGHKAHPVLLIEFQINVQISGKDLVPVTCPVVDLVIEEEQGVMEEEVTLVLGLSIISHLVIHMVMVCMKVIKNLGIVHVVHQGNLGRERMHRGVQVE